MAPSSLSLSFGSTSGDQGVAVAKYPGTTIVSVKPDPGACSGRSGCSVTNVGQQPISITIRSGNPSAPVHPVFNTKEDRKTMAAIDASKTVRYSICGPKEGFKISLNNSKTGTCTSISPKGNSTQTFVINPSSPRCDSRSQAIVIRSKNDGTVSNDGNGGLKVHLGEGKSAMQLQFQLPPQGQRGEVQMTCSSSPGIGGKVDYNVEVHREKVKGETESGPYQQDCSTDQQGQHEIKSQLEAQDMDNSCDQSDWL